LSHINFEKELHITITLGKSYHFYIDFDEESPNRYFLNRRLSIREHFSQFQKWLGSPIHIQLKEQDKITNILVNAQTFVMIHNQQRVWSDPIMGTFSSSSAGDFSKARIKLKCSFATP